MNLLLILAITYGSISGKVLDSENKFPLAGAVILIKGTKLGHIPIKTGNI